MSFNREMLKGNTTVLVLSLLNREPMYGYQMIKEIKNKSNGIFSFKEGTLYPLLHSLESKGVVESYWWGESGSRQRKYYQITTEGQLLLEEKKKEWALFSSTVDNILLGVAFVWI
ncbi:MAG: PadR family transcriptional regulator [Clostridia bacterium]|nr:PadR family transcriptional regulator [Clostridia bacterium]